MGVELGLLLLLLKKLLLDDQVVVLLGGSSVVEGLVLMLLLLDFTVGVSLEVRNIVASVKRLVTIWVVEGSPVVLGVRNSADVVTAGGGFSSNSSRM